MGEFMSGEVLNGFVLCNLLGDEDEASAPTPALLDVSEPWLLVTASREGGAGGAAGWLLWGTKATGCHLNTPQANLFPVLTVNLACPVSSSPGFLIFLVLFSFGTRICIGFLCPLIYCFSY